ncbi:hypothetical protein P692DRAFT_20862924 [Suillus brevipes Sb2]|nr:hypothetical protein P692DRAFT_20862924 [Suillus brevipes Sb2]
MIARCTSQRGWGCLCELLFRPGSFCSRKDCFVFADYIHEFPLLKNYELVFSDSIPNLISTDIFIYPFFMHSALTLACSQHPPMRRCPRLHVIHVCTSLLNPMGGEGAGW